MQDPFGMEILKSIQDLPSERSRHHIVELADLLQHTSDRTTGDIFEEDTQIRRGLFESEVLDDVWMVKVLESLTLHLQRLNDSRLSTVTHIAGSLRKFNLLDCNHLTRRGIEGQVYASIRALADQFTTNPLESSYEIKPNQKPNRMHYEKTHSAHHDCQAIRGSYSTPPPQ